MSDSPAAQRDYFMVSERLGFGIWRADDDDLAGLIWGDAEVTRLTGGPFTPRQVRERLDAEIGNQRDHGLQYWPLFQLDSCDFVGCCGLRPRNTAAHIFELGFQLCRGAWGKGYASEAARAVISWATEHGIAALIAGHHPENEASGRALQRLGFRYTHDELYPPTGQMEPCYRLGLPERRPAPELDRDALASLINRMLRAEAREDAPPQAERGDWIYGSVEPLVFTEPDRHGWMAIAPSTGPKVWIPRALCFWREVVSMGAAVSLEQMTHPAHALTRWPGIERAVLGYIAASFPPLALTDSAGESITHH